MSTKREHAQSLIDYINSSPTPFQSVDYLKSLLDDAGAEQLYENMAWSLDKSKLYYLIKDASQLIAFRIGRRPIEEVGFRIAAAHHDSPGFRIKPIPSEVNGGLERLNLEPYGGAILHSWLDRPLAVAGRVCVKNEGGIKAININIAKPLMVIPSVAIHIMRDVNDGAKFNVQTEMNPFFAESADGKPSFINYIAEHVGVSAEDILSYELSPYEYQSGCFVGANEEFISIGRLDDAAMVHASFTALLSYENIDNSCIAIAYDHEEIGSKSTRGAGNNSLMMVIDRICEAQKATVEGRYRSMASSLVFSADMAHATHPSYEAKHDLKHQVKLNGGPVLKSAYYQSYATSAKGSAIFKMICKNNDIPYQVFVNRSDARGGGTIGPMIAAEHGITTVDIGNPQLSMHSIRELCGAEDHYHMTRLFKGLFELDVQGMSEG